MKLTVLHVIPSLVGGGAERQLVELAAALTVAGVDVHLAYLHGGPNLEAARRSGATLHLLSAASNHDPRVILQLRQLVKQLQPAVVQTWLLHADVFGGLAACWSGVPWLLSERSSAVMYEHGFKFKLRRWVGLRADGVVANSDGGLAYWRASGYRGMGEVIRNIVRAGRADHVPAGNRDARSPTVLAVGRLSEEKNYPLLLTALEQVFKARPDAVAIILGEGPERPLLEARIRASALLSGRVSLPGYVSDVARRLAAADAYVSLSRFEGTPNTVVEAVLHGCPLVLSDIPAHREWLSGQEARWVPLDEPLRIAQAITAELADPIGARARVAAARSHLEAWSGERIAAQFTALYQKLTRGSTVCVSS